jgi:tRNA (guanine6-N2)-methyltransferase
MSRFTAGTKTNGPISSTLPFMAKHRSPPAPLPSCYSVVLPGLEPVASEEVEACEEFQAEVKKTLPGVVVFRTDEIDESLLRLRTVEDVFLLAWGTDDLTFRAEDLRNIERWTARDVKWDQLLQIHHRIRPKPAGKPTYRLVTQMTGHHVYRRIDAGKAMARGLAGKFPASWRHAEENAAIEVWLTIHGRRAVCGMRLSDRTMRHRTYKQEHMRASLRPTMAAALVWLGQAEPGEVVLDPMCGAGTILAEQLAISRKVRVLGGDHDLEALRNSRANLLPFRHGDLACWDARALPLPNTCVDVILSNPPFGKQISTPAELGPLYRKMIREYDRVLRPGGRLVLLAADYDLLKQAIPAKSWKPQRQLSVRVLGQKATIGVWHKGK